VKPKPLFVAPDCQTNRYETFSLFAESRSGEVRDNGTDGWRYYLSGDETVYVQNIVRADDGWRFAVFAQDESETANE